MEAATLPPSLTIDPASNAEAIAHTQSICQGLCMLIVDLARINYLNCKRLGDESGMEKARLIGESAKDFEAMLPDAF